MNAPQHISHYRIIRQLGAGGMGEVYLAEDTRLDRPVALKLLPPDLAADGKRLRRFLQEAKLAAALHHPNVCVIHEVGEAVGGQPFLAMEYIEGQTLTARINGQPLELADTLQFAIQIADALDEAHAKGIIHRDLKSANVLINSRNQAKVLDFGLAKLTSQMDASPTSELPTQPHTESGTLLGTVPYMSPEQARGQEVDGRSDLFSLGIVLYEMATGKLPFPGSTMTEVLERILNAQPDAIARFNYNAPAELERIIRKCLEKERGRRYQSAKELLVDLKNLKRDTGWRAMPTMSYEASRGAAKGAGESDPQAVRTTVADSGPGRRQDSASRRGVVIALVLALLIVGLSYGLLWRNPAVAPLSEIKSLAVLPLENLSGDPAQEYFADGMTDAVIGELAKVGSLRVVSRTSAMYYKGVKKTLPQIASELKVDAAVEGTVARFGERVQVRVQLIRAVNDQPLWSETYDYDLHDVPTLQSAIARAIAREVRTKITPDEQARLANTRPVNREAYDDYLRGIYYWNRRTEEHLLKAIDYFNRAIREDATYAPAYALLADCYIVLAGFHDPRECFPYAKDFAAKALELDATLAEAHIAQAVVKTYYEGDRAGGEQEFKRAIDLNAGNSTAHMRYAYFLSQEGRIEESLAESRRALELDPVSLIVNTNLGQRLYNARRFDEAIEQLRKALDLDPNFFIARLELGHVFAQKGRYDESLIELNKAVALSRENSLAALGYLYAVWRRTSDARQVLAELQNLSQRHYISPVDVAAIYTSLGEKDQAFAWLDKAFEGHEPKLSFLKVEPKFDSLQGDSRFDRLLRQIGLTP